MIEPSFSDAFQALTGNTPFPWQERLYDRFARGDFPLSCSLPTGLGKTSVIAIWLLALAGQAIDVEPAKRVPRRLAYVVNRRTIVDQATSEAKRLRENIQKNELRGVHERLTALCGGRSDDLALVISTLRGQFADNGEWSADPARPAIIVGTVDMIGSRLLFSGYGRGFKHRPLHAGFLGQDTLLVHDEAHLEPAFQDLLDAVKNEQVRCKEFRSFHVMPLTATPRGENGETPFVLTDADFMNPVIKQRLEAVKTISLHPLDDEKKTADVVARIALDRAKSNPDSAIMVFVRKVEDVKKVVDALIKGQIAAHKIEPLTGTLRGKERDELVERPVFQHFLPKSNRTTPADLPKETVFLVCTSAGEVGVDISAEHLVCDLTPFDSMAQRFGRVNRYGHGDAKIDVVHPTMFDESGKAKEYEGRRNMTLELLKKLNGNGSPKALNALPLLDQAAAFSPTPKTLPATDILFDAWALTTIRERLPGRPPVADWLHGVAEWQPPETQVAWRDEVEWITGDLLEEYPPEDLLEVYPLKPHELLRDRSDRVFKELGLIADRLERAGIEPDTVSVWITDDRGIDERTLQWIIDRDHDVIANRTVILPPFAGGLSRGMLKGESESAADVADEWLDERDKPRRTREWDAEKSPPGMRAVRPVINVSAGEDEELEGVEQDETDGGDSGERPSNQTARILSRPPGRSWMWYARPRSADDDGSRAGEKRVELRVHTHDVTGHVKRMVAALEIEHSTEGKALVFAARWHDLGKDRQGWQRSIWNNEYPTLILAKSGNRRPPRDLSKYRHEFGSLLDVLSPPFADEWGALSEEEKNLTRHFIAAHHGRARPHFPPGEAFDPERPGRVAAEVAREVPGRFARLQRRYGRWGLAYLESILRAADAAASARPSKTLEEESEEPLAALVTEARP